MVFSILFSSWEAITFNISTTQISVAAPIEGGYRANLDDCEAYALTGTVNRAESGTSELSSGVSLE